MMMYAFKEKLQNYVLSINQLEDTLHGRVVGGGGRGEAGLSRNEVAQRKINTVHLKYCFWVLLTI